MNDPRRTDRLPQAGLTDRTTRRRVGATRAAAVMGLGLLSIAAMFVSASAIGALTLHVLPPVGRGGDPVTPPSWTGLMRDGMRILTEGSPASFSLAALLILIGLAPALMAAPAILVRNGERPGMPLKVSMAGAAVLGGLIALLLAASAIELLSLLRWSAQDTSPVRMLIHPVPMIVAWTVTGSLWTLAIRGAGSRRDPRRIDRAVRWLFAGSLVELAIAAPTFALASRRDSCFCGWMSWWGIVLGSATLLLLCGPLLLLLRSHDARVQWMRAACPRCGYPQRSRSGQCAECGHAFGPAVAQ